MANLTLLDHARIVDPNGKIGKVVELFTQNNAVLEDMVFIEGNLPTGHRSIIRTGLPAVTWRRLYKGVQPSKSTTKPVDDTAGMLEGYSVVDQSLADLNGNAKAWRLSEDESFIESMNQEVSQNTFYGNVGTDAERFTGLAPRYGNISTDKKLSGYNVISGGGAGDDNTSVWLVGWGESTIAGFYPKGSQLGIKVSDHGLVTVNDDQGNPFEAYRTHFKWDLGLMVRDWRYASRLANIDVSNLGGSSAVDLISNMLKMRTKIPNLRKVRPVYYCNAEVMAALMTQMLNKSNVFLTLRDLTGPNGIVSPVLHFLDIPVKQCDAIGNAETLVS